jgi:hypothetical protein
LTELQASVEQLAELSDDADRVRHLNVLAGQAAPMFAVQADNVKRRLLFIDDSRMQVEQLIHEHLQFNNAIKPTIEAAKQAFSLSSREIIEATERSIDHLNQMSMKGLFPILMVSVQATNMAQAISAGYRAETEAEIDATWRSFVLANSVASRQLGELEQNRALAGLLVSSLYARCSVNSPAWGLATPMSLTAVGSNSGAPSMAPRSRRCRSASWRSASPRSKLSSSARSM